jgi:hypothetical protein
MSEQIITAEQTVSRTKEEIIKEANRIEESALYSSKGHFRAASFWGNFHIWLGIPIVILAALAGASFVSKGDSNNVIGGVISLIIAVLTAVATFLNPNERSSTHFNAGNNYDSLQNKVRIFRTIECWEKESDHVLSERLKDFSDQKDKLNKGSPQISWWAYRKAKKGIEAGEAEYEVDSKSLSL